jgi:hypothetical protein
MFKGFIDEFKKGGRIEDYYLKGAMAEIICVTSFLLAL